MTFSGTQLTRAAAQSIGSSSYTEVTWTAEVFDYGGWWSSGTDIIVPAGAIPTGYTSVAGLIVARCKFASNGTGNRGIQALVNGSSIGVVNISAASGETTDVMMFEVAILEAADVITVEVWQSSGGNLNITQSQVSVLRYAPAA